MNKFEKIKFASIGGNNETGDGSFELPYRTIQYAISDIPTDEFGWRVVLMSGKYNEPNLELLPNITLQAMIPNTVTIANSIIFAYDGNYNFNGIDFSIIDNYVFTCTNNVNLQLTFTNCNLTAIPTVDSGCGIFNIDKANYNISIVDSLLSIQNYQELVSVINTTINSNGVISLNNCEIKAIKNNQMQLDAIILLLNGNTKVIVENSKIYGQTQIENNASILANKTNFKNNQLSVVITHSSTTSKITHCNIDCETNPVIDGLGALQVAECCFLNNGTRFSTTLNNNTGIYYLPTTSPRLVDQALPESIQSGALYYAQGNFYDDRISRFKIPQADQLTGIIPPEQLPDAEYGKKGINYLISVRKGATKQSTIDMEAGNNIEIDATNGVAIFNAEGQLTGKILVELTDGTTETVSKLKQGDNMDWVIDGETVTQSATGGGGDIYEIGDGLQTTLNPDTGKEILSTKTDVTQFTYDETGAIILTPEVQQDLAKGASSVQSVNDIFPDAEGNVDITIVSPVLELVSDYVGDLTVLHDWLLAQPNQESKLYFITKTIPNIVLNVPAVFAEDNWTNYCAYINGDIQNKYDGIPDFKIVYASNGRLYISTNDALNPISMYIPTDPTTSLNTQMFLTPPGATIVSKTYVTVAEAEAIAQTNFDTNIVSIQEEIDNNKLIINDVFIKKINNGENVTINVDSETNTATFSATGGGSGGANKVTVTVNGQNPKEYPVDGTGNITIDVPLTNSLEANWLNITTETAVANKGKTNLHSIVSNDFTIVPLSKELQLSANVKASLGKADTAIQTAIGKGNIDVEKQGTQLTITGSGGEGGEHVYPEYWQFNGNINAKYDTNIIPSVSNILAKQPFPSKTIYIAMEILNPPVASYSYKVAIIKTGTAKNIIQKSDVNILTSGIIDIASVTDYYNNQPSLAGKTIALQFVGKTEKIITTIEQSDTASLQTIANKIQATARSNQTVSLPLFTCKIAENKLVMNSNNLDYLLTYPLTTGYPLVGVLKLAPSTAIITHDYEYAEQFETNPKGFAVGANSYSEEYYWATIDTTTDSINVTTAFIEFTMDVSSIRQSFSAVDYNRLLIEFTADSYTEVKVNNPNQFYNRLAHTEGATGTKRWESTNNILPAGISYSPQIIMQYNNNAINAGNKDKVYAIFDFAKYPFSASEFSLSCIALYKDVIAPIASYELIVVIKVKNDYTDGIYTVNGGKNDVNVSLGIILPNMWQNGVIENKFLLECDNNNIIFDAYMQPINNVSEEVGNYVGKTEGQVNLAQGIEAIIKGFKVAPDIGDCKNLSTDILQIDNQEIMVFTFAPYKKYQITMKGYIGFTNSYNSSENPVLAGLVNVNDLEDYIAVPIYQKVEFNKRHNINISKQKLILDLTNVDHPKQYRILLSTANIQNGVYLVISDNAMLHIKEI